MPENPDLVMLQDLICRETPTVLPPGHNPTTPRLTRISFASWMVVRLEHPPFDYWKRLFWGKPTKLPKNHCLARFKSRPGFPTRRYRTEIWPSKPRFETRNTESLILLIPMAIEMRIVSLQQSLESLWGRVCRRLPSMRICRGRKFFGLRLSGCCPLRHCKFQKWHNVNTVCFIPWLLIENSVYV